VVQQTGHELVSHGREFQAVGIAFVLKEVALAVADGQMHVHAIARPIGKGLGH